MIVIKPKGELGPLHCDKVSFTLAIKKSEEKQVLDAIGSLLNAGYLKEAKIGRYTTCVKACFGEWPMDEYLVIQAQPTKPNVAFLRFEFNPAKFPVSEARIYIDEIVPDGGYKRLTAQGTCTRIDITVDVHLVEPSDLLIRYPKLPSTAAFGKAGRVETLKLGSGSSSKQVKVYDKRAQLKKSKKGGHHDAIPDHSVTRIEFEYKERFPAKKMASIPNPLAKLEISHFRIVEAKNELFALFLLASQFAGMTAAFERLGSQSRKEYSKRISRGKAAWWHPDDLWVQWKGVAKGLMNPPKGSFNLHPPKELLF